MLKIREGQKESLEEALSERSFERLAEHLAVACAARVSTMSREELLRHVREGVAHADRYEIEQERDLRVFLECRLELGPGFDREQPWAVAILNDASLFPEEKATYLSDRHLFAALDGSP
jgi:5-carboxymethyl-2-hydroxymuconate isomerase